MSIEIPQTTLLCTRRPARTPPHCVQIVSLDIDRLAGVPTPRRAALQFNIFEAPDGHLMQAVRCAFAPTAPLLLARPHVVSPLFPCFRRRHCVQFAATTIACGYSATSIPATSADMSGGLSASAGVLPATSFRLKGLLLIDRRFRVPLDYSGKIPGEITMFAREVINAGPSDTRNNLPYLVYFQGGPGFESPRMAESGEFRKLAREHRLLLLDQRGTGLSTPISAATLTDFQTTDQAAAYLKCFRAPSIVRDAELIRKALVPDEGKWSLLGQSFGGFCILTYLSQFPWHISRAYLTGGVAPIDVGCSAENVYRNIVPRVLRQMDRYYDMFPADEDVIRELVLYLDSRPGGSVPLPSGSFLSTRGLQALGLQCLGFPGSFARLHYALERAWEILPSSGERILSSYFLHTVETFLPFTTNPLYFLLHEPCYCNAGGEPSNWAAERVRANVPILDASKEAAAGRRVYFTGEMVFPFMLDEIAALRPLKDVAHRIATATDWEPLYSEEVLKASNVPTAAAVYYNDMFVDFNLSMDTVAKSTIKTWITSEYTHAGIRESGDRVIDTLTALLSDKVTLESF
jgi:pimeloyl-ACP methyl ester carboxylesterase